MNFLCVLTIATQAAALQVIGLGAGRTGTESLKVALIELGFGPAYHMKEALFEEQGVSTRGHVGLWEAAAKGEPVDFARMLAGFESGCDFPMSAYPEEMLAAFPDAKFVLTVRPAEQWWSSISSSICWFKLEGNRPLQVLTRLPFFPFNRIKQQMPMMDAMVRHKFARDDAALDSWTAMCVPPNRERTMTAFDAHTERVKQLIPRERLLVFEAGKNSYAELASFLGVDAPEGKPYPRINSRAEFAGLVNALTAAAVAVVLAPVLVLVCCVRCFRGRGRKPKGE